MSLNYFSNAVIGMLLGLLFLALGPVIECDNLAGVTTTFQCPDGMPISSLWQLLSFISMALGISSWLYRNKKRQKMY